MKLTQLRYVESIVANEFNISKTADSLYTTQPGVSTQVKALEDEIGTPIFIRHGKRITGLTPAGLEVYQLAQSVLQNIDSIKQVGQEFQHDDHGTLTIATTHTQARYTLPGVIQRFSKRYPHVRLRIRQGNPTELSDMLLRGDADLAIATEALGNDEKLHAMPVFRWNRCIIARHKHPILNARPLTLEKISQYPIITYDFAFTGRTAMSEAFNKRNLKPNIVITALDADVIKHYVELELGIGILARMAYNPKEDKLIRSRDAGHLFDDSVTVIGVRKGQYLRTYIYAFIEMFAPHLSRQVVNDIMHGKKVSANQFDLKSF